SSRISASFDLFFDPRLTPFGERRLSFAERFGAAAARSTLEPEDINETSAVVPLPDPGKRVTRVALGYAAPERAPAASSSPDGTSKKRGRAAEAPNESSA